jgi:regulator of cell morphogenesis and NO signaling
MEATMNFSQETKVKEIALSDPKAKAILEEAGVDYCCGGSRSLHDACAGANVSASELLDRLQRNREQTGNEDQKWISGSLADLTAHIRDKHHAYVRTAIPRVRELSEKVKAKHQANHPEVATIRDTFQALAQEMIAHMQKEEQILFPYIGALERASQGKGSFETPFFQTVGNPIQAMMREHDGAGDLARQIRQASSGYTAPPDACQSYRELYTLLSEFEADLHQHIHLENNILFPRAVELEAAL